MSVLLSAAAFVLLLAASALFSGSETGCYSLSRLRLDAEAREGRWTARVVRRLLADDAGLLVTILVGNNLMIELLTHLTEERVHDTAWIPPALHELAAALVLTPVAFFFAELLPKDLFHRRPNTLVAFAAPFLLVSKVVFLPLVLPLRGISFLLERLLSLEGSALTRALGREAVLELLEESTRRGALAAHAQFLARNALELKSKRLETELVPWSEVRTLPAGADDGALRAAVRDSSHTRLPVVRPDGSVDGYVHQLDVLAAPADAPVLELRRPLLELPPDLPVDRALARLRIGGQRLALVGTLAEPVGIVSLKDLVETISGDLADW